MKVEDLAEKYIKYKLVFISDVYKDEFLID